MNNIIENLVKHDIDIYNIYYYLIDIKTIREINIIYNHS